MTQYSPRGLVCEHPACERCGELAFDGETADWICSPTHVTAWQVQASPYLQRVDVPRTPPSDPLTTFTCPDCRLTSPSKDDVENSYCVGCHEFKYERDRPPRCMEPTCPDFGSYDFGEAACPQEHAVPPARR